MTTSRNREYLILQLGRESVRLAYVDLDDSTYVVSSDFNSRWPSNLMRRGEATLIIGEIKKIVHPVMMKDAGIKSSILSALKQKYGQDSFEKWFPNPTRFVKLSDTPVEKSKDKNERYFNWLEDEFDSISSQYDRHIFGNSINVYLRDRSVSTLTKAFKGNSFLLEIGPGSGTETVEMLKLGNEVVAADISGKMLEVLNEKARALGLQKSLTTVRIRASKISDLYKDYRNSFDGIYSTYGAINCEPDIMMLPENFSNLTTRKSKVLLGVYNKLCVSEPLLHAIGIKPQRILERMFNPIPEGKSRFCIDVYAYTPSFIQSIFKSEFSKVSLEGVPVFLPPSNYDKMAAGIKEKHKYLTRIDTVLSRHFPFNILGDHFLILMEKNSSVDKRLSKA